MTAHERTKKAVDAMQENVREYMAMDVNSLDTCISKGNKKIGNTLNVSLPPVISCGNCSGCSLLCYDIKAVLQYGNVRKARARNYAILLMDRKKYFDDIRKACKARKKNKYFRFHVAGDIPDIDYFDRMVKLAREFPEFKFWTYTKMYGIVNVWCRMYGKELIPENLSVMFSEWRGMKMTNPFNFPEFRVVFKDEQKPAGVKWCAGNCNTCIHNNSHCVKGETVYCMEH